MPYTSRQIADAVGGELDGSAELPLTGVETLERASPGELTFIGDPAHARRWPDSGGSAALVDRSLNLSPGQGKALIRVEDADLAMARALELFAPPLPRPPEGVHPDALVHETATLGVGTRIDAHCTVGAGVVIGDGTVLHAGVRVMDQTNLGADAVLWPGVVVRERCRLGDRVICHPHVTLGADGFGYRPAPDGKGVTKIPQIGSVEIGDDVEIGAGTCIDRGKFSATVIGQGSKIDNLVQIGHNNRFGQGVIVAGSCAIAGSVTIEDGAMLGGGVIVRDHVTIGRRAHLAGGAQVVGDVPPRARWGGIPARPLRDAIREVHALQRLPEHLKQMRRSG